ncbi:MAG: LysR family transcriptional regulator [Candidatus Onthomonas sp.]
MELRTLRYFLAVAQEGSISAAANYLYLTQPNLSRQMSELEAELGKTLFVRGKRKITLTEEGKLLRQRAMEILELVRKTEDELASAEESVNGDVYIGAGETNAFHVLAEAARRLRLRYPEIRFHLHSGNAEDVAQRLDSGLLDFELLIQPVETERYDFLSLPERDTWGVLMRKDSPLADREVICPQDLRGQPLIMSRQTMGTSYFPRWMGEMPEQLRIAATYNLIYNASVMVEEGLGYALCLDKLVDTGTDSALCFRPLSPRLEAGMDVVWKKRQVFSRAAELFLKELRQTVECRTPVKTE